MPKFAYLVCLGVIAVIAFQIGLANKKAADVIVIPKQATRLVKAVQINHKKHDQQLKVSCQACHHDMKKATDNPKKCGACHLSGKTGYKDAYHKRCIACHRLKKIPAAPTKCTGCHRV